VKSRWGALRWESVEKFAIFCDFRESGFGPGPEKCRVFLQKRCGPGMVCYNGFVIGFRLWFIAAAAGMALLSHFSGPGPNPDSRKSQKIANFSTLSQRSAPQRDFTVAFRCSHGVHP
jgi:hypothetical protein